MYKLAKQIFHATPLSPSAVGRFVLKSTTRAHIAKMFRMFFFLVLFLVAINPQSLTKPVETIAFHRFFAHVLPVKLVKTCYPPLFPI